MISTQEVARMLNVAETTLKRWSDEGIVPCVRTPGGHRKFLLKDITRFAANNGYTLVGSEPPPMNASQRERLEVGVHTRNYMRIAQVFEEEALQADQNGMLELLLYLHAHQIPFPAIADEIIRPAFTDMGIRWKQGEVEVSQEHAASYALSAALTRMVVQIHRKELNGMAAVCACPEGEFHDNGLRTVAYSLEIEGWKVHFIGSNTPFETLKSFVRSTKSKLVCLSMSTLRGRDDIVEATRKLRALTHTFGGRLVTGGYFVEMDSSDKLACDFVAHSASDMLSYVREVFQLKPGPKKKIHQHH